MTCKECGKSLRKGATVCPRCGAAQTIEPDVVSEEPQMVGLADMAAKAAPTKKRLPLWATITIISASSLLLAVLIWAGLPFVINYFKFGSLAPQESKLDTSDLAINEALVDKTGVQNIALFGLDSRTDSESGRSDAMIILSIDRDHGAIKMTSIARDSLVNIGTKTDKYGESKVNHAFAWGGAKLAVQTLNSNFGMNITDYVYINFFEFVDLVDEVGGIMIDVNASEARVMNNKYSPELLQLGFDYKFVQPGYQRLSGAQALAYSRDRYTGSELERGNRHKEVLQALFAEVKDVSLLKMPNLIATVLGMCHTTLTDGEMLDIATWALSANPAFSQFGLPSPACKAQGGNWNDGQGWVWRYDMGLATAELHKYIYEVEVPYTTTASKIPLTTTTGTGTGTGTELTDPTGTGTGSELTDPTGTGTGSELTDPTGTGTGSELTDPTGTGTGTELTDPTDPGGETDPTDPGGETDPTEPGGETDPTEPGGETDPTGNDAQE